MLRPAYNLWALKFLGWPVIKDLIPTFYFNCLRNCMPISFIFYSSLYPILTGPRKDKWNASVFNT